MRVLTLVVVGFIHDMEVATRWTMTSVIIGWVCGQHSTRLVLLMRAAVGWHHLCHGGDVVHHGHVVVVAEPPACDIAVDVQVYALFSPWWMLTMQGTGHEGWQGSSHKGW